AVNTGEALVNLAARPEAGEGMAAGDVVNTAARLQSAAPVNGILVGETTYRATSETIDYAEHSTVEAKGNEAPIRVWDVLRARAEMVKAQAGILETDNEEEVEAKLARAVEQLIQEDADWVLFHLRPLVGLASDLVPSSPEEAFAAWRRFFEALAEQRSIVLVF